MSVLSPIEYPFSYIFAGSVNAQRLSQELLDAGIDFASIDVDRDEAKVIIRAHAEKMFSNHDAKKMGMIVRNHIPVPPVPVDEIGRGFVRSDSRDAHDTTCYVAQGDVWVDYEEPSLGVGDGVQREFFLTHKEVRNLQISANGFSQIEGVDYVYDATQYDPVYNEALHYSRGKVTFQNPPGYGIMLAATYQYAVIGGGTRIAWNAADEPDITMKIVDVVFCDSVHLKDGMFFWMNGSFDAEVSVDLLVPPGYPYLDNNKNLVMNNGEEPIRTHQYVKSHPLFGDCPMGCEMITEARSQALMPGYIVRMTIKRGSATNLQFGLRVELNRQRLEIL